MEALVAGLGRKQGGFQEAKILGDNEVVFC
jgi:hypothetical protein